MNSRYAGECSWFGQLKLLLKYFGEYLVFEETTLPFRLRKKINQ